MKRQQIRCAIGVADVELMAERDFPGASPSRLRLRDERVRVQTDPSSHDALLPHMTAEELPNERIHGTPACTFATGGLRVARAGASKSTA